MYGPCTSLTTESVKEENGIRFIKVRATVSTNRINTDLIKTVRDRDEAAAKARRKYFVVPSTFSGSSSSPKQKVVSVSDSRLQAMKDLKEIEMPLEEFVRNGYSLAELKQTEWFSLEEFLEVGFDSKQLFDAGFSISAMTDLNCYIDETWFLKAYDQGESLKDLIAAGWKIKDVKIPAY